MSVEEALQQATHVMVWVHERLDKLKIAHLPNNVRVQVSGACWLVATRHGQGIVSLMHDEIHTSALAMVRCQVEAYLRGMWLSRIATDDEIMKATEDTLPGAGRIFRELEERNFHLSKVQALWDRLCSYNHTGLMQFGAMLTVNGLEENFHPQELTDALNLTNAMTLLSAIEIAGLAQNEALGREILEKMREVMR